MTDETLAVTLTLGQRRAAVIALEVRIDHLREQIVECVTLSKSPYLDPDARERQARYAVEEALDLAHAEHAYRELTRDGYRIDSYLPAVYRPLRAPAAAKTPGPEAALPPATGPAVRGDRNPPSVSSDNLSEPVAPREVATAGELGGGPAVASERLQPCCAAMPPEHLEGCPLVAKLTDRHGCRYVSPLGDRREHAVRCSICLAPDVWSLEAVCDRCATAAGVRALTHLNPDARKVLLQ